MLAWKAVTKEGHGTFGVVQPPQAERGKWQEPIWRRTP